ncbi:hypothetical protein [Desulfurococcus mucosus]|uniref:hypothetical protein n=1 Tax=Desulfurococcus mucosus TaxID=2275 RepID=UPI00064E23CE|nr:hypothetical protein [Desulfurococcus mucosus]
MNPVIEAVSRDLRAVLGKVRETGVPEHRVQRVENLLNALNAVRMPQVVTAELFRAYMYTVPLIKELEAGLQAGSGELEVYMLLDRIEEKLMGLGEAARRSYIKEKLQLSIPVLMSLASYALFTMAEPTPLNTASLLASLAGVLLFYINTFAGLLSVVAVAFSSALLSALMNELRIDVLMLEAMIAVSALLHIYIVRESRSTRYVDRVARSLQSVDSLVASYLKPADAGSVASLLNTVISRRTGGIPELLRYKAAVMLMNGYSVEEVEKRLLEG